MHLPRKPLVPLVASALAIGVCAQEPAKVGTQGQVVEAPAPRPEASALAKAMAEVRRDHKRLLVVALRTQDESPLGDAAALRKLDKDLARTLSYEYVIHPLQQETAVAEASLRKLPVDWNGTDFPMLQIVDDAGTRLAEKPWSAFISDDKVDAARLRTWLEEHKAPAIDARKRLAMFLADAKKTERRVLLHLGAPW